MRTVQISGRRSSLFTRVPLIVAHELDVGVDLTVIHDMTDRDASVYGGNPALKLPTLQRADGATVFGAENICRVIAEGTTTTIIWPEQLHTDLSRNAQEMLRHAMAAQIQIVMGTIVCKLPADNLFFEKCKAGLEGALGWLERHGEQVIAAMPERTLSLFEVELFCLIEHIRFRPTTSLEPYPALMQFTRAWRERASARETEYRFDIAPT